MYEDDPDSLHFQPFQNRQECSGREPESRYIHSGSMLTRVIIFCHSCEMNRDA